MGLGVWLWVEDSAGPRSDPGSLGKTLLTFTSLGLSFVIYKMRELNQNLSEGSCQL